MAEDLRLVVQAGTDGDAQAGADSDAFANELLGVVVTNEDVRDAARAVDGKAKQDAGVIIGVILASEAVKILAQGIADWLRSRHQATVEVTRPDGTKVMGGTLDHKTARAVIEKALEQAWEKQP